MLNPPNKHIYHFGEFRLDAQNRLLWRGAETVALTLKEFEVLLFLVENAGEVVDKNSLLDAVWKDVFIEEGTLTRNISRLRKKLENGDGVAEKIIETLPKRGYRFLPAVTKSKLPAVVIEERTQTLVRIEETIAIEDDESPQANSTQTQHLSPIQIPALLEEKAARFRFRISHLLLLAFAVFAVLAFAAYRIGSNKSAKLIEAPRVVPFSGALGRENTPAFSPDGKQLAYAWNGGEKDDTDIYVRLVGEGEPVRLTDDEFIEQHPTFSPDGARIAFVRDLKTHGEVVIVPALGGTERRVCRLFSGFGSVSFAPDGKTLAVVDTENSTPNGQYAIYLVDVETGARRRLNQPGDYVGETTPRFAPDGKSVAFVRVFADQNQDLFVAPTPNGNAEPQPARQLTFDRKIIHSAAWSGDGAFLFFVSLRASNQPNLWRIAASGGEPELIPTAGKNISNIAVAPDGKTIAFVDNSENMDIWRTSSKQSSEKKFVATTYNEFSPHFAPDGKRVAFASNRTGKYEIWTTDDDGKNLRQTTDLEAKAVEPRFSPDGARIAFEARADGSSDIFTVSSDGGAAQRITNDAGEETIPVWSANGEWIYFLSNRTGEKQIWRIAADGTGEMTQVTRRGASEIVAAPPGDAVYFAKENDNELWRIVDEKGAEEQIVREAGKAVFWRIRAANDNGIYFLVADRDAEFKIKFYDFAAKKIREIDVKIPANFFGNVAAAPDGSVFLYVLQAQNASSIMLAELQKP